MKWLYGLVARIRDVVVRWLISPYRTEIVEADLPNALRRRTLYIVREDGFDEQAALMCPCGCRRVLHMNLIPDERPCWQVTQHNDGTATLYPSVWRKGDCGSHFWLRQGQIQWCRTIDENCASPGKRKSDQRGIIGKRTTESRP